jgi:hypothetical protein
MGKNSDRKSVIRLVSNVIVHELIARHTNFPESTHFLNSEVVEYSGQAEKSFQKHNWNDSDLDFIEKNAFQTIKQILSAKYSDVSCSDDEIHSNLKEFLEVLISRE